MNEVVTQTDARDVADVVKPSNLIFLVIQKRLEEQRRHCHYFTSDCGNARIHSSESSEQNSSASSIAFGKNNYESTVD